MGVVKQHNSSLFLSYIPAKEGEEVCGFSERVE